MELILQGIDSRHNSDSQDNDQPDYDSVASDEDPVLEATCGDSCNDDRTKVGFIVLLFFSQSGGDDDVVWIVKFLTCNTTVCPAEFRVIRPL